MCATLNSLVSLSLFHTNVPGCLRFYNTYPVLLSDRHCCGTESWIHVKQSLQINEFICCVQYLLLQVLICTQQFARTAKENL